MSHLTIAVDVDEVCADLLGEWLRRYNLKYHDYLYPENLDGWAMEPQVKPECGEKIFELITPEIYEQVLPIPGALFGINQLRTLGRVVFVTSGNGDAKLKWLQEWKFLKPGRVNGHDPDFVSAKDKSLIKADYLLDDNVDNVEMFPGQGILIWHWHNRNVTCSKPRVQSLFDAYVSIQQAEQLVA